MNQCSNSTDVLASWTDNNNYSKGIGDTLKNKNKLNVMKRNYYKVPHKLHSMNLHVVSIAIYSYLARGSEDFNPSVGTIATALNISKTTVVKYIKQLKSSNMLVIVTPGREKVTTKYAFTDQSIWKQIETEEFFGPKVINPETE